MTHQELATEINNAETTVALTGAGVSTASGIRDFRSEDGLYQEFDQSDIAIHRFERDPAGFWQDWSAIHGEEWVDDPPRPNPAHEALADLEQAGVLEATVTQNTDDLHEAAGSESVIHLHGTSARSTCRDCSRSYETRPLVRAADGDFPLTCEECGGVLKPDTVLFGEQLPPGALPQARRLMEDADVVIAAGSSLTVNPAASLPRTAARKGATVAIVNLDETPADSVADYVFREPVEEALPSIADLVLDS